MALTQISTAGVKDDAVTAGKIPANAVGSSEIADDAVTAAKMADNSVTSAQIVANAVVTNNIVDEAVTLAKLPHGTSSNNGKFLRANNGADPSFETIPPAAITAVGSTGANRVITDDGDGTATAEANLLFDGSKLLLGTTTSAAGQLIVKDTDNSGNQLWIVGRASNNTGSVSFRNNADDAYVARIQADTANDLQFQVAGSERMRINSSGRVGIGKSPSSTFDIETASNANGFNLNCVGTPANYLFNVRDDNVSKFYIKGSDSSIGIQTDEPINPLEIAKAAHYTTANSGQARSGIHIRGNAGNAGEYGGGISFGCKNNASASNGAAAIAARQATQDSDTVGLSFFTHPSTTGSDAAQEKLRIHHDGRIQPMYSSTAPATGGVMTVGAFNAKLNGHEPEGLLKARTDISNQSVFDAAGWYDNTNFRYVPKVKGYYIFHVTMMFFTGMNGNSVEQSFGIRLNGTNVHGYTDGYSSNYGNYSKHSFHGVIRCNGNTDYVDVTCSSSASTQLHSASNWSGWLLYPDA